MAFIIEIFGKSNWLNNSGMPEQAREKHHCTAALAITLSYMK
jgi:hypothetical protein